jgi:hypothetical protein
MRYETVKANVSTENMSVTYGEWVSAAKAPRHRRTVMQKYM